ncbi:hypothetical protein AWZ03_012851 [Drosophila navojoa]|uniref:Mitochondrial 2-oxodicarboxylate carrier n=1 Tax=Drosophila navojoa TaxID=7232 RepID=A0A484AWF2_DRONA|nr:hypothetical protein AWZ03_012851 [Drosophila navojoa]
MISGGCSSIVDAMLMQPLDVITTRLQLQSEVVKGGDHYKGMLDAFKTMYREEGITSFWRGLVPVLLVDTPRRTIKFLVFEQSKPYFMFGEKHPTPLTYFLAGGSGGMVEAIIQNPFEVVKVTQQASHESVHTMQVAKTIIQNEGFGFRGLYKGMSTTVTRNFIFNAIYFGFYWTVRDATPTYKNPFYDFLRTVAIACAASLFGCVASLPLDAVKTRIQGPQPVPGKVKYRSTLQTLYTISKEEGWTTLYKGLLPVVIRMVPGGAILLIGYEFINKLLVLKFGQ